MDYARGTSEALSDFGLEKTAYASAAIGALVGGGLAYLADPEHSWQATAMGALGGGAVGHGAGQAVSGARNGIKQMRSPAAPAAPAPKPAPAAPVAAAAPKPAPVKPGPLSGMANDYQKAWDAEKAMKDRLAPVPNATVEQLRAGAPHLARRDKFGTETGLSLAPGRTAVSIYDSPSERLPGMHRWVPRDAIEDVYKQLDMGTDPEDVHDQSSALPAAGIGAAAGGLLGHSIYQTGPSALIGAGIGTAAGLGAHYFNHSRREADIQEALKGVTREKKEESDPPMMQRTRHNTHVSARESMPLTVGTSVGM